LNKKSITTSLLAGLISLPAWGQATVGEVLDAGGKALSKEEVMALLPGANTSGPTAGGGQMSRNFKGDGTFTGNVGTQMGKNAPQTGQWKVDDNGSVCVTSNTQFRETSATNTSCGFFYKLGSKYFAAVEGGERGSRVLERTVSK